MSRPSGSYISKRTDLLIITALVGAGCLYAVATSSTIFGKALISFLVIFVPSIIYLGYKSKKPWKKLIYSSLVFGILFGFFFEFIQELNRSYSVISRVFPKVINIVPPDNVLAHALMTLFMLVFYEHFINQRTNARISPRIEYPIIGAALAILTTLFIYYFHPSFIHFDYSYAYLGLAAILPMIIYGYRHPANAYELVLMMPFFFLLYLVVEVIAVKYSWWIYPGSHYIGHVQIYSERFPFEELFFWMLLYAPAITAYYKLFVDS